MFPYRKRYFTSRTMLSRVQTPPRKSAFFFSFFRTYKTASIAIATSAPITATLCPASGPKSPAANSIAIKLPNSTSLIQLFIFISFTNPESGHLPASLANMWHNKQYQHIFLCSCYCTFFSAFCQSVFVILSAQKSSCPLLT